MPVDKINNVNIFWKLTGDAGEPLIMVHGSWGDHHNWDSVAPELAKTFRVLTYDRRGHSQSERPVGQGYVEEDLTDLIELIHHLNLSPAHIVGNSYGASIVLKTPHCSVC
jgi:pimeloyl-ACP methyl ester carboxylesterase